MEISTELIEAVDQCEDADALVQTYIALRDEQEERKRRRTEDDIPLTKLKDTIENKLHKRLQDQKAENIKTAHGTFYKTKKTSARVADFNVFLAFVKKNDLFNLLKKDVNKTEVEAVMNETKKPVPGIDWTVIEDIGVRRGK